MIPFTPPEESPDPNSPNPPAGERLGEPSPENEDDLVTVATFQYAHEAELAKLHLAEEGLRGFIADAETIAMDWALGNAVGYVKLQVAQSDAEAALRVLANRAPVPAVEVETSESTCLSCGRELPESASRCPTCGWSYDSDETAITEGRPPTA